MTGRKSLVHLFSLVLISFSALSCQASVPAAEIGMTLHFRGADAATVKRQFDLMADMNVTWVRVDIDWSVVERERGQFDWAYPDNFVDEAVARRMKVLVVLAFSPDGRAHRIRGTSPPATPGPITCRTTRVSRESPPSATHRAGCTPGRSGTNPIATNSGRRRPDANEYGGLFRAAADAIRSVDPKATLLIGGLAPRYARAGRRDPSNGLPRAALRQRRSTALPTGSPFIRTAFPASADGYDPSEQSADSGTYQRCAL